MEVILFQNARPIRDHDTMRRSCDRIFRNSYCRGKEARDEIGLLSLSRYDQPATVQAGECGEVGFQVPDTLLALEDCEHILFRVEYLQRQVTNYLTECIRRPLEGGRPRGEVHFE